ncbi:hypothetical protein SUGI_0788700 [Cryptomeria japonica]|uniref:rhomboid-like protein 20 isoform X2 n=1 Tax=Cryptomeria japonica TaxID=3369 RepID=UPI0024148820|nr:rhomboid-like protein 20 isoform X2 [Cryptomeria japonica]GLJ38692.1 hypothetical protein SUGI_0788700 [Cryptomeria japonica]
MNAGPSGFQHAPVTKILVLLCGAVSIIAATQGRPYSFNLSYQAILKKFHLWRLLTSAFIFSSTSELIFGLYLLYYFRVFERQIGSNKYSVFILFSTIFSILFELAILTGLKDTISSGLVPGPYGIIFSLFVPFFLDIPVSTRFQIFSFRFSDKSFVYLAGLQLLLSSWKRSFIPGICGVLAGLLYRANIFHIQRIKLPKLVSSAVSWLFSPLVSSGSSTTSTRRTRRRETINAPLGQQFQDRLVAPALVPSEEAISTLVSMGFDRSSATQALRQARNDIGAAADLLLSNQL